MNAEMEEMVTSDTIKRIANLSPEKRALLELRLMKKDKLTAKDEKIFRRGAIAQCPLSFSQQRLWLLDQFDPGNSVYNITKAFQLMGLLDVTAIEKSLNEIVQRHESLRTTFSTVQGEPVQIIAPTLTLTVPLTDLRTLTASDQEAELRRMIAREARRPFDLSCGPLLRAVLLRVNDKVYVLVLTLHHIVTDGWSMGVLFRELSVLYTAFCTGSAPRLSELPVQYADFAVWQRQWLQSEILEDQLSYWKEQLVGAPPYLELPTDRPRPAIQAYRGTCQSLILPPSLTRRLKALSREEGVTIFMILLAGFKVLLYRYTAQGDIILGSPVANRTRVEIEELIGFFVNTLILRTDLSGNPTFRQLLGRVREVCLGAYAHQDMPFEKLVEELQPERNLSHSPLFQVMFVLQNTPKSNLQLPGLTVSPLEVDTGASKFDLTLSLVEDSEAIRGELEYDTELFDAATIERLAGHYQTILEGIVVNPEQRLSELPVLTPAELNQLLVEWNDTKAACPADKTLVQLFEEQVESSLEAVAITCKDTKLTYGELNRKANQLASYLRRLGVGPDVLIGLCMERSVDMVVGLLGVLKAGGAYVPLDPGFPIDRLQFMLEDSGVPILLTQAALAGDMSGYNGKTVCIDSDWERISAQSDADPKAFSRADHLAYVIYTSGSTGRPKGVQIPHRALVNFLCSMQREPGLTSVDTVLSVTTISFDIFGLELFLPLISGAKVVLVERDDAADGARLIELLKESEATVMQATPATWRLLLQAGWEGNRLLKILCGGEALPRDLVAPLLERCKEFWNLYGPTETTIWSTVCQVKSKEDPILIGRPIANTQLYILDNSLQLTPVGVAGELHIGGEGLARGYLNRPELTSEKFIPHPFSEDPKVRVYKTGDLARYRSDGTIECLGRIDHQVKVRGYRIELGEIESRIKEAGAVGNCVVVLREDRPGDQRLTAYYVPRDGQAVSVFEVRRHLQSKLPEYMVPQHYVELESIPMTPNGKVDRKALPKPETDGASEQGYVAPRTETEQKIAGVWQRVLNREKVGVYDNFFEVGGHSLLATQVLSRVNQLFNMQLPLRRLFEARTVESLAEVVDTFFWAARGRQKVGSSQNEKGNREFVEL